jgi:hypothetical protein
LRLLTRCLLGICPLSLNRLHYPRPLCRAARRRREARPRRRQICRHAVTGSDQTRFHGLQLPVDDGRRSGLRGHNRLPRRRRDRGTTTQGTHECRVTNQQSGDSHITPCLAHAKSTPCAKGPPQRLGGLFRRSQCRTYSAPTPSCHAFVCSISRQPGRRGSRIRCRSDRSRQVHDLTHGVVKAAADMRQRSHLTTLRFSFETISRRI